MSSESTIDMKAQVHGDLISDLRINEDCLNFIGILEEENSVLKNLWEQMEHTSDGDENNSDLSPERSNICCGPVFNFLLHMLVLHVHIPRT